MISCRHLSPLLVTTVLASACSFDFERDVGLEPGDVSGRALRGDVEPAPYARAQVNGSGREHRTRSDGSFVIRGLVPGGFALELSDDKDGDGWPERAGRRTFTLTRASHAEGLFGDGEARASWIALGDVRLEGVVEAEGRVLHADGTPAVGARVFGLRSVELPASDDGRGALSVELPADAEIATDIDGRFRFPALPAGTLSFVAFTSEGGVALASEPVTRQASAGLKLGDITLELEQAPDARRVLVELVPVPSADELVRVHVVAPGAVPPLGQGSFARGEPGVLEGARNLELDVPLGAWDLWVETSAGRSGVLRRQVASMPGGDLLRWGLLLLSTDDACAGTGADGAAIRDCDHDGLQGLPPLDGLDDPDGELWRECAPQCARAFGEAALGASCQAGGESYDCDDDGDGQPDVTESMSCYGLGRGADPDGDGLCGAADPYPQCRENDPAHESCRAGGTLTDFPPPVRPEHLGGEEDAGPTPDGGGDAGSDGGSLDGGSDAGSDAGVDAGPPAFTDRWGTALVQGGVPFGAGVAVLVESWGPIDLGGGCVLEGSLESETTNSMLALIDDHGQCHWHVVLRATSPDDEDAGGWMPLALQTLTVLESGELLVAGHYQGAMSVHSAGGEQPLPPNPDGDLLLLTVDESGVVTRAKTAGLSAPTWAPDFQLYGAAAFAAGGFVLTGMVYDVLQLEIGGEPVEIGTANDSSYLLLAFDGALEPVWHHSALSAGWGVRGLDVVTIGEGAGEQVAALVGFEGALHVDEHELFGEFGALALLAYPTTGPDAGTLAWHRLIDGVPFEEGSLARDVAGGVVVGATSPEDVLIDDGQGGQGVALPSQSHSMFLARYDESGALLQHHRVLVRNSRSRADLRALEALPSGELLLGGDFRGAFTLGDYEIVDNSSSTSVFVARVALGAELEVRYLQLSSPSADLSALVPLPDESALVFGSGSDVVFFGGLRVDFEDDTHGYVWRILPDGTSANELLAGFADSCDASAACASRRCGIPSWLSTETGFCLDGCSLDASSCPSGSTCQPDGNGGDAGVCVPDERCFHDAQCGQGRCDPFTQQCEPGCATVDDCAAGEACHLELGVCVPDCFAGGACSEREVCAPSAGGYVCQPDCARYEHCSDCGQDGLCSAPGTETGEDVLDDTWVWDPTTLTWTHHGSGGAPGARTGHAMGGHGDGVVVLLGGVDAAGTPHELLPLVFDGDGWQPRHPAIVMPGYTRWTGAGDPGGGAFIGYSGVFGTGQRTVILDCCESGLDAGPSSEPTASREGAAMAYDGLGRVWLFGGRSSSIHADLWSFDAMNPYGTWEPATTNPGPVGRYEHALSYAGTPGALLLSGGRGADDGILADTWSLVVDGETNSATWTLLPDAALGHRAGHATAWDGQRVVLYGGATSRARTDSRDILFFDESSNRWTAPRVASVPPAARTAVRMAFDGERLVLHGGERGDHPVEVHEGVHAGTVNPDGSVTWAERRDTPAPAVAGAAFASDVDGGLWVFGGRDAYGALTNELVVYGADGSVSVLTHPTAGPSAREGARMAFHPTSGALFLFGGRDTTGARADLWRWNDVTGAFEEQPVGAGGPLPRAFHAMAPSVPDGSILLFGGHDNSSPRGDHWLLSGDGTFTEIVPSGGPSSRTEAAFTSGPDGVYVYGGFGETPWAEPTTFSDLWIWEGLGNGWRALLGTTWPTLAAATITYEPGSSPARLWHFGGSNSGAASQLLRSFVPGASDFMWPLDDGDRPPSRGRHVAGFVGGELLIIGGSDEPLEPPRTSL